MGIKLKPRHYGKVSRLSVKRSRRGCFQKKIKEEETFVKYNEPTLSLWRWRVTAVREVQRDMKWLLVPAALSHLINSHASTAINSFSRQENSRRLITDRVRALSPGECGHTRTTVAAAATADVDGANSSRLSWQRLEVYIGWQWRNFFIISCFPPFCGASSAKCLLFWRQ